MCVTAARPKQQTSTIHFEPVADSATVTDDDSGDDEMWPDDEWDLLRP
jgi:hypothetical protein